MLKRINFHYFFISGIENLKQLYLRGLDFRPFLFNAIVKMKYVMSSEINLCFQSTY